MTGMPIRYTVAALVAALLAMSLTPCSVDASAPMLQVPAGFTIELWADGITGARSLALGDKGTVFVGTHGDKVYAIPFIGGHAGKPVVIGKGLNQPNGVAFHNGALIIAEIDRLTRYPDIETNLAAPPKPHVIRDDLPTETHHGFRYIAFGPDGKLYLPIGAPCNVCEPETFFTRDSQTLKYGSITRMNADGSDWQLIAEGVRNSVGYDWNPKTQQLWFTDNGRDLLGDDVPSDELNRLTAIGSHFGFPYCHQGDIADPEFGKTHLCKEFTSPVYKLGAHVAALGMRFYTGQQFPAAYRNTVLVAEHGSWNRSSKVGYRVVAVTLDGDQATGEKTLVDGFLSGQQANGRPVDLLQLLDGSMLISDDQGGRIWRLSYKG